VAHLWKSFMWLIYKI